MASKKTVVVTGASQGIGAAIVQEFLDRGYNVVATSRNVSKAGLAASPKLALVDGDIGHPATAEKVAQTAIGKFGSIDHLVNNAGIYAAKPFTDYTINDFRSFVSVNADSTRSPSASRTNTQKITSASTRSRPASSTRLCMRKIQKIS